MVWSRVSWELGQDVVSVRGGTDWDVGGRGGGGGGVGEVEETFVDGRPEFWCQKEGWGWSLAWVWGVFS